MKHLDLTGLQEMGRIFKAALSGLEANKADITHGHTADEVTLTETDPTTVAKAIEDLRNSLTHIEEVSELTVVSSDPDADGVYKTVTWTRRDGTTYAESTLSGDAYNRLTVVYYDKAGTGVDKTISWNLTIDANGTVSRKELTV